MIGRSAGMMTWTQICSGLAPSSLGGLDQLFGDGGKAGHEDQQAHAERCPELHGDQAAECGGAVAEPIDRDQANRLEEGIEAAVEAQHDVED